MAALRRTWVLLAALALSACGGKTTSAPEAGVGDAPGEAAATCTGTGAMKQANGQACGCGGDCVSGFCVDGVCCNTACADTCKSCNTTAAPGTCAFVPNGAPPRAPGVCPK